MSSSSPRNANPHAQPAGSSQPGRKRTQEVETPEGSTEAGLDGSSVDPSEAVTPAHGLPKAPTATTALEAAEESVLAAAPAPSPPESPAAEPEVQPGPADAGVQPVQSFLGAGEGSPLSREIEGAAEHLGGEWRAETREVPGAAPSTPLEMMDETEMMEDVPTFQGRSGLLNGPSSASVPDEEFLRRVVLPPLPQQSGSGSIRTFSLTDESSDDKTVISDPPTPEMLASLMPSRATAAIKQKLAQPVELTTLELFGLLTGSAVIGGIIGALFLSMPEAAANRPARAEAAVVAPAPATRAAPPPAPVPDVVPLPRPTVESLPTPPERVAPEESSTASRAATPSKRARRNVARKPAKKEWVDPFEQ